MYRFTSKVGCDSAEFTIYLDFDQRSRSRIKTNANGEEVLIVLPRGQMLFEGECVQTKEGVIAQIALKNETLRHIHCSNTHLLARACYHLGNRHLAIEIQPQSIYFREDPIIADMLTQLGLESELVEKKFYPENGAYGGGKHFTNDGHTH